MPDDTIITRTPRILYKQIERIQKEFEKRGLKVSKMQVSKKLGFDLQLGKINIDLPVVKQNNQTKLDLGGGMSAKLKKR